MWLEKPGYSFQAHTRAWKPPLVVARPSYWVTLVKYIMILVIYNVKWPCGQDFSLWWDLCNRV